MKKWSELLDRIVAERRQVTGECVGADLEEMPLHRSREARRLTRKQIGEAMRVDQSRVLKIERRTDLYVSTLRNFVSALGGELELVARFPDGRVQVTSFSDDLDIGKVEACLPTPDADAERLAVLAELAAYDQELGL